MFEHQPPKGGLNFPTFLYGAGIRGYSFYLHIPSVFPVFLFHDYKMDPYELEMELYPHKWPSKWATGVITPYTWSYNPAYNC